MQKTLLASIAFLFCSLASMANMPQDHEMILSPLQFQRQHLKAADNTSNMIYFKDMSSDIVKESLSQRGLKVYHSFEDMVDADGHYDKCKSSTITDGTNHTLTVNIKDINGEISSIDNGIAYSNSNKSEYYFMNRSSGMTSDKLQYSIPQGNYDIEVNISTLEMDLIILTATNIDVTEDCEITLDIADANVEIKWNPLLPDASSPTNDTYLLDPQTYNIIDIISGNVKLLCNTLDIYNKKHNFTSTLLFIPFRMSIGETISVTSLGNIRVTPNNDQIFYYKTAAIGERGGYGIALMADATQSETPTNDLSNYITLKPEFAETPWHPEPKILGAGNNEESSEFDRNKNSLFQLISVENGELAGLVGLTVYQEQGINISKSIHICQEKSEANEFEIMPVPSLMEDWDDNYNTTTLPITSVLDAPRVLTLNNTSEYNSKYNFFLTLPEDQYIYISQVTNPWLSFDVTKPHIWNYGCPVMVFSCVDLEERKAYNYNYIGRLGERRSIDLLSTSAKVTLDGTTPPNEILENIKQGLLPMEGKLDFVFIDTNVAIEEIPGKNITHICLNMACLDWQPPTLQIVRFIDNNGNFTDCFTKGEEGIIEFYGGDFSFQSNLDRTAFWYNEVAPKDVKLEYAPYGTESFLPLGVEKLTDKNFMPGFGTYYSGSLSGVNRKSDNGWFDVRITLTDASGNFQKQILSPAFKIDKNIGIDTTYSPEISIKVLNNVISVYGCENPTIELYSPCGILLEMTESSTIDICNFDRGIYIINVRDCGKQKNFKILI